MKYDLNLCWNQLSDDPQVQAIIMRHLPFLTQMLQAYPGAGRISIQSILRYTPGAVSEEQLDALRAELREYGSQKGLTDAELEKIKKYKAMAKTDSACALEAVQPRKYDAFHPGKPWYDTNGRRIQAHAGALYHEDGVFYWYGENKTYTDGKNPIWTWGIRIYRSVDLYNWEDLGQLVMPVLDNPDSNLFPEKYADRPHIIRSELTGKYVMWIKISSAESCFAILQADHLLGPYEIVKEGYYPLGCGVGDFDLVMDPQTHRAYLFMDTDHQYVACFELTEDHLDVKRKVSAQYEGLMTPLSREGIAMFQRNGRKYMITSGRSGYTPNQSEYAQAENWTDVFVSTGDPHVGDDTLSSFNSQISQVFKVPGKEDLYIAIADRWMPDHLLDRDGALAVRRAIGSKYMPDRFQATAEDHAYLNARPDLERANTRIADYVWLPVHFVNEQICIAWHDTWQLSDYEDSK